MQFSHEVKIYYSDTFCIKLLLTYRSAVYGHCQGLSCKCMPGVIALFQMFGVPDFVGFAIVRLNLLMQKYKICIRLFLCDV